MDKKNLKNEIRRVYQFSNSKDDLFDNFRTAIDQKIKDLALYNTLLWNKTLPVDEILMFAEKICKEIPEFCFDIYLSVAKILDTKPPYEDNKVIAFNFIKKAAAYNKNSSEPYVLTAEIYNKEFDVPPFGQIADFLENGIQKVREKSKISFLLARLYGRIGDVETGKKYQKKGEEYLERGE